MSHLRAESPSEERRRLRRVMSATVIGTTVEWYDFYLYATMSSIVFAKVFFHSGNTESDTLKAFATFSVGFIARPVGGILFGHLGDLIGRKRVLVTTFILMGISTAAIGLLPTADTAGMLAPVLLVLLRILQGMGAGAEYASAAVNAYEHAREERRGRQGAWPALGLNLGLVLSSATIFLLTLHGDDFLLNGGWRIPFIFSLVLVAIGMWVRSTLPESPEYQQDVDVSEPKLSLLEVLRTHWSGLGVVFIVAVGYNALSYIFKTFSVAYLTEYQHISANTTSGAIMVAGLIAIITVPLCGELCDRFGSRTVIGLGGGLSIFFSAVFLWLLGMGQPWAAYLAIGAGTGILAPMMFAAQGSFLSHQFPTSARSTGVGTAREIGTAVAGGLAPLGALSLVAKSATHSTFGVGIVLAISGVAVALGAALDRGKN
ncbi:MFS transporter [Corynebacterium poyangense]|uniref:MFS transporter n=1 Tax=Corynebacterium poyangense TaxID=2684405 RepID=A0A7H0SL54_9CORY|nr:MFS transporter [Corynebacterium poyangense]MBZ8177365.1 MFS transporter [Corynebacterium poyangense]QNQ89279.1 MFS transporter [Corynebacterium poyangense]